MRIPLCLLLSCLAWSAAAEDTAPARAATPAHDSASGNRRVELASDECGLSTPFSVLVDSGGVWLYRNEGSPREIFFHAGELSVDQQVQVVGAADAQRLWRMEVQARQLMPQVADLARDVVDFSFDVFASVVEALTGSRWKERKVKAMHQDALRYVDGTLGQGRWDQSTFDERLDRRIEAAAEEMAGSLARSVMWQLVTGRVDAMEERTERMEAELEARIEPGAEALAAKAQALCPQVQSLYALQQSLEYRYRGEPLRMIDAGVGDDGMPAEDDDDHGDHPGGDAIRVSAQNN